MKDRRLDEEQKIKNTARKILNADDKIKRLDDVSLIIASNNINNIPHRICLNSDLINYWQGKNYPLKICLMPEFWGDVLGFK